MVYHVRSVDHLNYVIIPFFLKYPLRGTKYLDFLSFKEAFFLISKAQHLTEQGIGSLGLLLTK
jgi:hypothetical protein